MKWQLQNGLYRKYAINNSGLHQFKKHNLKTRLLAVMKGRHWWHLDGSRFRLVTGIHPLARKLKRKEKPKPFTANAFAYKPKLDRNTRQVNLPEIIIHSRKK